MDNNKSQEGIKELYEIINKDEDLKKCREYIIRVENNEDILVEAMNYSRNKVIEITIKDLDAILANRVYPLNEPLSKNSVLNTLRTLEKLIIDTIIKEFSKDRKRDNKKLIGLIYEK